MDIQSIERKVDSGTRISSEEASWLFRNANDNELKILSKISKARYHSLDEATYLVMAIINYTNVCVAGCDYCAFYRLPHQPDTYLLSTEQVIDRAEKLVALGGDLVSFNGGFHPKLTIHDYARLFRAVRSAFKSRDVEFFEMTIAEFMFSCKLSKVSYEEGARILKDSGTKWITGGGAEILEDGFRDRHSPGKYKVSDYFDAQRAILDADIGSTATMVIGFDESLEERISHLESLRDFQDSVDGRLVSFLCWTYKPENTKFGGQEVSSSEYLRWLAVCRIFLDNFRHIRTSVLTRNEEAFGGLDFGANDFDLPTEDEVTQKAGAQISLEFERLLDVVRAKGIKPIKRKPFNSTSNKAVPFFQKKGSVLDEGHLGTL